jgi:hypothetical protein
MSRPRWQMQSRGVGAGVCEEGTSSGSGAMRERRSIRSASVGNRAAIDGGSMSTPRWQVPSAWGWNRGLRRGTTSSGSGAVREPPQINARH